MASVFLQLTSVKRQLSMRIPFSSISSLNSFTKTKTTPLIWTDSKLHLFPSDFMQQLKMEDSISRKGGIKLLFWSYSSFQGPLAYSNLL